MRRLKPQPKRPLLGPNVIPQSAKVLGHPLVALTLTSSLALLIYLYWIVLPLPLPETYSITRLEGIYIYLDKPYHQVRLLISFLTLGLLYLWGWWAIRKVRGRKAKLYAWIITLVGALGCTAALLYLYPFDAADIFDNIMHGRILAVYNGNPFVQFGSNYPGDPFYDYMAWKRSPTAYGPLWEIVAGFTARLAGDGIVANVLAFKLLPGIFWLACVVLIAAFMLKYVPRESLPAVYLFAWNPMLLYATFGNGHNDITMVCWILVAIWAIQARHHTGGVLALLVGALVKFIPLLLVPAAVWIGVKRLFTENSGANIKAIALPAARYLALTALLGLCLVWLVYSPFWQGTETLSIERRSSLYSSSIPAVAYHLLLPEMGKASAAQLVSRIAGVAVAIFVFCRTWRMGKDTADQREDYDRAFAKASFDILVFYLLVTCLWFQQWYTIWLVGIAAMLTYGRRQRLGAFISLAGLFKQLLIGPLLFKPKPILPQPELEIRFTLGVLAMPWLYTLAAYWGPKRTTGLSYQPKASSGEVETRLDCESPAIQGHL
jgi:hypothetical protein